MKVRCINADNLARENYLEVGKDYDAEFDIDDRYYIINGILWNRSRFIESGSYDPASHCYDQTSHGAHTRRITTLEEQLLQLEVRLRQMQDQLDHHDHKTNIDFTVETETK